MEEQNFFSKYHINPLSFDQSGLKWEILKSISEDYSRDKAVLTKTAKQIVDHLMQSDYVHSINYRIKKDEHLIEKIIRKKIQNQDRNFDLAHYRNEITDLIGVRVLHLFKEDWIHVNNFLKENWELKEQPVAYVRNGDSKRIIEYYQENNCRVKEHPYGYRSVHYIIKKTVNRKEYNAEIQVRTIFEEAWGEIDHFIRYPYHSDDELLFRLSSVLNRISGSADELSTYIRYLKNQTKKTEQRYSDEIKAKNKIIDELKSQIDALEIAHEEKFRIAEKLDQLERETENPLTSSADDTLWLDTFIQTPLFKNISSKIEELGGIEPTEKDLEIMGKAQSELKKMLNNPEKLKELLSDKHVSKLIEQLEDNT